MSCGSKPARTAWGIPPRDVLPYLGPEFSRIQQWLGAGSRHLVMHMALRVSSGQATSWTSLVKCHAAWPWLYFLTPPCPMVTAHPHTAHHLVMLVLRLSSHTCRDPVPAPFLRTSSTSLPLALSNSLFPKLLNSHGAEEILALPVCPSTLQVKSSKRKEGGQAMGSFSARQAGMGLWNFVFCGSDFWLCHLCFELSLKKHMAPDSSMPQRRFSLCYGT